MNKTIELTKFSKSDPRKNRKDTLPISVIKMETSVKILRQHSGKYYNDKFENICEMVINS